MSKILSIIFIIFVFLFSSCATKPLEDCYSYSLVLEDGKVYSPDCDYVICIEKNRGEDFTILNFSDVQLSGLHYELSSFNSQIDYLHSSIDPDLITLTGDLSYGFANAFKTSVDKMESLGTPWAPVFGNHDDSQVFEHLYRQSRTLMQAENCLFMEGPKSLARIYPVDSDAYGNYVVNIVEIDGDSFRVVRSLIFMNSGDLEHYSIGFGERYYNYKNYARLTEKQQKWFLDMTRCVQIYDDDMNVPCGVFVHIPPTVYNEAALKAYKVEHPTNSLQKLVNQTKDISFNDSYDSKYWNEGYEGSFGTLRETVGSASYDDHFFDNVLLSGCTDFIVAGHDHDNNFVIDYEGVKLIYSLKTGISCYASSDAQGGTVITVHDDGSVDVRHALALLK